MGVVVISPLWFLAALQSIKLALDILFQVVAIKAAYICVFEADPAILELSFTCFPRVIGTVNLPAGSLTPKIGEVNLLVHPFHGMPWLMFAEVIRAALFNEEVDQFARRHIAGIVVGIHVADLVGHSGHRYARRGFVAQLGYRVSSG